MAKIRDCDRESTSKFIAALPSLIRAGDRVGFRDEDGFQVATVDRLMGQMVLVVLKSGGIWPLRMDELLPPF